MAISEQIASAITSLATGRHVVAAAVEEDLLLTELRALAGDHEGFLDALRQAVLIAQFGGLPDQTLTALLRAMAREGTDV